MSNPLQVYIDIHDVFSESNRYHQIIWSVKDNKKL